MLLRFMRLVLMTSIVLIPKTLFLVFEDAK
jgi:hypothetical protein